MIKKFINPLRMIERVILMKSLLRQPLRHKRSRCYRARRDKNIERRILLQKRIHQDQRRLRFPYTGRVKPDQRSCRPFAPGFAHTLSQALRIFLTLAAAPVEQGP